MNKRNLFLPVLLIITALCLIVAGNSYSQTWQSCDRWASWSNGGYTLYNNGWGSEYNYQCIWANSYSNWGVNANHPAGSLGIKSYPNVSLSVNYNVDNMPSITSSFTVTVPGSGSYNTAYDIWYNNYAYEVMLWMNKSGVMGPIASSYNCNGACPEVTNVSIGGHTWNVYRGSNGTNQVFSFVRTSNTNSGTVDITAISKWLRTNGWFGNANLHSIQFGWEITEAVNLSFSVTRYSVTIGSSSCNPTAITPYIQVNDGTWQQVSSVTVNAGAKVKFGPQPVSGGSWSWTGCGTSGTSREQTIYPAGTCTATATYTNSCGARSTQNFTVTVSSGSSSGIVSGGTYRIIPRHSGKTLDVSNCGTSNGTNVQQWSWLNNTCQQWILTDLGNGYWRISPANATTQALDVSGVSVSDGANVQIWSYLGGNNQQWQLVNLGNGYYNIKARHSGKCLDVNGVSTADGANVIQWTCGSGYNQQWSFTRLKSADEFLDEMPDAETALNSIYVYPNPLSGKTLHIELPDVEGVTYIKLYSLNGILIEEMKTTSNSVSIEIDGGPGMYLLQVINDKVIYTEKITVK